MPDYLTTRNVGAMLSITDRRVRQLIAEKRLPACKLGKAYMVLREDVEKVRVRIGGWPKGKPRGPQSAAHKARKVAQWKKARRQKQLEHPVTFDVKD
jgi:excisionase family DNA binding protein